MEQIQFSWRDQLTIEIDYPTAVLVSEKWFRKWFGSLLDEAHAQEVVPSVALADVKSISLMIGSRISDGEVFVRAKGQWVRIIEAPPLVEVPQEAIDPKFLGEVIVGHVEERPEDSDPGIQIPE